MSTYELTDAHRAKFESDGYLVLPNFVEPAQIAKLLEQARKLLADFSLEGHPMTKFTTDEEGEGGKDKHVGDDYFLTSSDKIRFFFEADAFDAQGNLTRPKEEAINKIGHGLHELDPVYRPFSLENDRIKSLAKSLQYHHDPLMLQSMIICKQPRIGAKVPVHDDSTFLYTDPPSAIGYWFALEDCHLKNGCLSFLPGSHKRNAHLQRFVRLPEGGTGFEAVPGARDSNPDWSAPGERWVTEECKAGTLVLIHGSVIHKSEANLSDSSRFIYTFHMIEGGAKYDEKNWLQPTPALPFSKLVILSDEPRMSFGDEPRVSTPDKGSRGEQQSITVRATRERASSKVQTLSTDVVIYEGSITLPMIRIGVSVGALPLRAYARVSQPCQTLRLSIAAMQSTGLTPSSGSYNIPAPHSKAMLFLKPRAATYELISQIVTLRCRRSGALCERILLASFGLPCTLMTGSCAVGQGRGSSKISF